MTNQFNREKRDELVRELAKETYAQIIENGNTADVAEIAVEQVLVSLAVEVAHLHKQAQL